MRNTLSTLGPYSPAGQPRCNGWDRSDAIAAPSIIRECGRPLSVVQYKSPHPPSAGMARSVRPPVPVHAHLRTHRRERREICEEPQGGQAGSSRREQVRADPGRHPSAAATRRDATKFADTAPTSAPPIWLALAIAEHRLTAERHEKNEHQPTTTTNIPNDNEYSKQQRTFQTTTNTNNDRRL